jgi:quercetin dioxygenase-like cupin family protein
MAKKNESVSRRAALGGMLASAGAVTATNTTASPIGLAPTARSKFAVHSIDHAAMDRAPLFDLPFSPGVKIRGYSATNQPNCQVIIEDFMPGTEFWWTFAHDEFQYVLSGEMELEVYLPPLYSEVIKRRIKAGDVFTYPVGARKHVKVIGDKPVRHICFCPPSPDYPFPTYESLIGQATAK